MIKDVRIDVLVDDHANPEKPVLWPEHGLSLLITIGSGEEELRILFDAGASGESLLHNSRLIGADLNAIDVVVLSHGHYDHTGGLAAALEASRTPIPVIAHPDALCKKFALKPRLRYTGIPYREAELERLGGRLLYSRKPIELADGILVTGEIPRENAFEGTPEHYVILRDGELGRDYMLDDQALVIRGGRGLTIITGCAHAGIINTIDYARKITGIKEVHAVIGGFHLVDADEERLRNTLNRLKEADPKLIAPCHCTGETATKLIRDCFGARFMELRVGSTLELRNP